MCYSGVPVGCCWQRCPQGAPRVEESATRTTDVIEKEMDSEREGVRKRVMG